MTRLRFLVSPSEQRRGPGAEADELLSVSIHRGVVPRSIETDDLPRAEDLANYKVVRTGDIVLNRMRAFQGAVGMADREGIVSPDYTVLRTGADVEARYLHHLFRSRWFVGKMVARLRGIGSTDTGSVRTPRVNWEDLGDIDVSAPSPAEQRAIADYLDAETARIDALIANKQQLIHLLDERAELAFDSALSHFGVRLPLDLGSGAMRSISLPDGWRVAKLSSALRQLTNGYVGPTRDILVDEGIRYVQGLHVKKGKIDFERRPFFVTAGWHRARQRTALRPGDVVIVQTGDIGQCAVVPDDLGEANCHALLIARANPDIASGQYLAAYLQSKFGRQSLLRLATGALHPHLEFGIRDAALLLPPRAEQSEIVAAVQHEQGRLSAVRGRAIRQLGLLSEHRQALITAAVTGEFAVPSAA